MKVSKGKAWGIIIVIIVLIIIITAASISYSQKRTEKLISFAKCLKENNIRFYGSIECSHCETQKKMFKTAFQYLDYVECGSLASMNQECLDANITATPTWTISGGNRLMGLQTFNTLSEISGCKF